jgi:Zn/Cd-binding protein ZinT
MDSRVMTKKNIRKKKKKDSMSLIYYDTKETYFDRTNQIAIRGALINFYQPL